MPHTTNIKPKITQAILHLLDLFYNILILNTNKATTSKEQTPPVQEHVDARTKNGRKPEIVSRRDDDKQFINHLE